MANKLQIADALRTLPSTAIVKHIIATRETTDVVCVICGRQTPASSLETLNVIVSHNRATGTPIVQLAHPDCAHRDSPTYDESRPPTASSTARAGSPSERTRPRQPFCSSKPGGAP